MPSPPVATYQDAAAILERLTVLYGKAERVLAYNRAWNAGNPDRLDLLDEKQRTLVVQLTPDGCEPGRFPRFVWRTLRRTIDRMHQQLATVERRAA